MGDQSVWGKHTLFENASKSTFIIKVPNDKSQNLKVDAVVESVDLYLTLLELCSIPLNHKIDGESLVSLLEHGNTGLFSE